MIPETLIRIFYESYPETQFKRGHMLVQSGENPEGMFYLVNGYVRMMIESKNGEELTMHMFKPGSMLPVMWLVTNEPNRYAYQALTPIIVKMAPTKKVQTFFNRHPDLAEYFLKKMLFGMSGLLFRMESLVLDEAYEKVIRLFLYLAGVFRIDSHNEATIGLRISHRDVASWIGTARETASLMVEKLRKKKLIVKKGPLYEVPDILRLEKELKK